MTVNTATRLATARAAVDAAWAAYIAEAEAIWSTALAEAEAVWPIALAEVAYYNALEDARSAATIAHSAAATADAAADTVHRAVVAMAAEVAIANSKGR